MTSMLDLQSECWADLVESGDLGDRWPTRHELHLAAIGLVRRHGAAAALELLHAVYEARSDRHDTLTTFVVWSADRLLGAGLDTRAVVWHPLMSAGSELAWWDAATLASDAARTSFVASTRASTGDPAPHPPARHLALAS